MENARLLTDSLTRSLACYTALPSSLAASVVNSNLHKTMAQAQLAGMPSQLLKLFFDLGIGMLKNNDPRGAA